MGDVTDVYLADPPESGSDAQVRPGPHEGVVWFTRAAEVNVLRRRKSHREGIVDAIDAVVALAQGSGGELNRP